MAWIKRNLYFVIGIAVALLMMGAAGWFLYNKWDANNQVLEKLNQDYEELKRLNAETPHPGAGQINNIKLAQQQRQELRAFIDKTRSHFQRIEPIPNLPKISDRDFSAALSRAISDLQRQAAGSSVALATNCNFSFEAQKQKVSFPAGSLPPLSVQLGEVKAICDLLLKSRINALDYVRRERVCSDDTTATSQADYLNTQSETNELAILSHYEVGFRCFSAELAAVLAEFAGSPYGLLIKSINVEPSTPTVALDAYGNPVTYPGAYNPQAGAAAPTDMETAMLLRRRMAGMPMPQQPAYAPAATPAYPQPIRAGGLQTVLDEKPLKVTFNVVVVKLLPSK